MNTIADHRRFFAEFIVRSTGSSSARLIDAFASVPREDFLGAGPWQVFVGSGYLETVSDDPRLIYQNVLIALAPERKINNGEPSLRVGGRLVMPLTPNEGFGAMLLVTRTSPQVYAASAFVRAAFIPCIGARDDATSASLSAALERQSLKEVRSLHRGTEPDATAWCAGSGWWLSSREPG